MNSKSAPQLSSNSLEASCFSSFENIAHRRDIGRKIAAKKMENKEIRNPKTSPFLVKSIEYKFKNEYITNSKNPSIAIESKIL